MTDDDKTPPSDPSATPPAEQAPNNIYRREILSTENLINMLLGDAESAASLEDIIQAAEKVEREATSVSRRGFMGGSITALSQARKLPGMITRFLTSETSYTTPNFGIPDSLPFYSDDPSDTTVDGTLVARMVKLKTEFNYIVYSYAQQKGISPISAYSPLGAEARNLRKTGKTPSDPSIQRLLEVIREQEQLKEGLITCLKEAGRSAGRWEVEIPTHTYYKKYLKRFNKLFIYENEFTSPDQWKPQEEWEREWEEEKKQRIRKLKKSDHPTKEEPTEQEQDVSKHPTKEETPNTTQQDPRPEPAAEPGKPSTYTNPDSYTSSETRDIFDTMKHAHDKGHPEHQTWRERAWNTFFNSPSRNR